MAKGPTLKPDRPLAAIVFPKSGAPYLRVEHPPRVKEALELAVGRKFLGALKHFHRIELANLRRGDDPPDLVCEDQRTPIQIEVVEIVDQELRQLTEMRTSYADRLELQHGHLLDRFDGCRVSLVDAGDPPYLPGVDTPAGQACMLELAEGLAAIANEIGSLLVKKTRSRKIRVGPHSRGVSVQIDRLLAPGTQSGRAFQWTGGGPCRTTDQERHLSDCIAGKISKLKGYGRSSGELWLLAYSRDVLIVPEDEDLPRAAALLANEEHPFDRVWYFWPYDNEDVGHVVEVWSRSGTPAASGNGRARG